MDQEVGVAKVLEVCSALQQQPATDHTAVHLKPGNRRLIMTWHLTTSRRQTRWVGAVLPGGS